MLWLALLKNTQQVMHSHSGIQNIFNDDNNFPFDTGIQVSSQPHLTGGMHFISITRYRNEIKRNFPWYLPGKVGQKKYSSLQYPYEVQRLVPKIFANFVRQLFNALFDPVARDEHADTFLDMLSLTGCSIILEFCSHGMDSNRIETLAHASLSEQAAPRPTTLAARF